MRIYVVRHGETSYNLDNKVCGLTDLPLTDRGMLQAKQLAEHITDYGINKVYVSPMLRARQTAEPLCERLHLEAEVDERLIEQNYGSCEGMDRLASVFQEGKRKFVTAYPDGGESMFHLAQRVYDFLDEIIEKDEGENVLLVCHGGVSRMIHSYFYDMTNEEFPVFGLENCQVAKYLVIEKKS